MGYCNDFVKNADHADSYKKHCESCGKSYKKEAFHAIRHLFRKKVERNTFDINFRKSQFCYGPWSTSGDSPSDTPYFNALRPLDLRTDIKGKYEKKRYITEAVKKLNDDEIVTDDTDDE